jgi:hypothetical protein
MRTRLVVAAIVLIFFLFAALVENRGSGVASWMVSIRLGDVIDSDVVDCFVRYPDGFVVTQQSLRAKVVNGQIVVPLLLRQETRQTLLHSSRQPRVHDVTLSFTDGRDNEILASRKYRLVVVTHDSYGVLVANVELQ